MLVASADARSLRPTPLARPGTVNAGSVGLESNDAGYFHVADGRLWVSAAMTLARPLGDGATQFGWETFVVRAADTRSDEGITAFAVSGSRVVVATAHSQISGSNIYGVGDGLYLSSDGGERWQHHLMTDLFTDRSNMTVPGGDTQCFGIWFDGPNLWAAFTTEFAVMTPDFGATWQRYRPDSTNNPQPEPFLDDPGRTYRYLHLNYRGLDGVAAHDTIWVGTNAGINRSADGGVTWTNFDARTVGLTGDFAPVIEADTVNGIVWAATQATGIDEQTLKNEPRDIFPDGRFTSLDYDLDRDGELDGPGRNGVSWTADGGETWIPYVPADDPLTKQDFRPWGFGFRGRTVWVAGTAGGRDAVLRSYDVGESWELLPVVAAGNDSVASDEGLGDVEFLDGALWATTARGLLRSTDDGTTWSFVLRYPQPQPLGGGQVISPGGDEVGISTYAFPSPSAPVLGTPPQIVFALTTGTDVTVEIYDAGGGLVRTIMRTALPAGNHMVAWDGRNEDGRNAANGVYLYRIRTADGHSAHGKMMVLN